MSHNFPDFAMGTSLVLFRVVSWIALLGSVTGDPLNHTNKDEPEAEDNTSFDTVFNSCVWLSMLQFFCEKANEHSRII